MMWLKKIFVAGALSAAVAPSALADGLNIGQPVDACASSALKTQVGEFYEGRPGAPLAIPGRRFSAPEVQIATALPGDQSLVAAVTAEQIKDIWTSIDAWGEQTFVRLVFTMKGAHVTDFPSLVPVRQEDLDDGWLDIYADNGDGVHGHLWLGRTSYVAAVDMPAEDGARTKTITFYAPEGHPVIGVYARLADKDFDQKAVKGFEKTKKLIAALPQLCS